MITKLLAASSVCLLAVLSGCAGTAQYMKSQSSTYYKPSTTTSTTTSNTSEITLADADLAPLFKVKCMKEQDPDRLDLKNHQSLQCLYVAVDAAQINTSEISPAVRDKAIAYLIGISDSNCSNFLDRSFANKAGLDISKSLTSDLATGISAVTAFNTPAVSAGLSLANLVVGKTADNFNETFYFKNTFQAFEAAVMTERARIKNDIIIRQASRPAVTSNDSSAVQYGLFEAMADIRSYDNACSMRGGLAKLVDIATTKKDELTKILTTTENKGK